MQEFLKDHLLEFDDIRNVPVDYLEMSVRSANVLKDENINTIGDLIKHTEAEMLRYQAFGRKSLNELKEALAEFNLTFATHTE
jgi:DNA-directed RNA polymerase subunit alpha